MANITAQGQGDPRLTGEQTSVPGRRAARMIWHTWTDTVLVRWARTASTLLRCFKVNLPPYVRGRKPVRASIQIMRRIKPGSIRVPFSIGVFWVTFNCLNFIIWIKGISLIYPSTWQCYEYFLLWSLTSQKEPSNQAPWWGRGDHPLLLPHLDINTTATSDSEWHYKEPNACSIKQF